MPPFATLTRLLACLLPALGGCTVYAPMQPVAPLVRQAGQAEIMASVQPTGRVEATVAYAPRPRLLVLGGLTAAPRLGEQQFLVTGQYEVGAGLYQPLGPYWVLSGLGGLGQAYSHRGSPELGNNFSEYEARYAKVFGQVGIGGEFERHSMGLAYRLTYVSFSQLDLLAPRSRALPLASMLRHELALADRVRLAGDGRWQLATTVGLSVSDTPRLDEYYANYTLLPALLVSLGVVYRLGPIGPSAHR